MTKTKVSKTARAAYDVLRAKRDAGQLVSDHLSYEGRPVYLTGINTTTLHSLREAGLIRGRVFLNGRVSDLEILEAQPQAGDHVTCPRCGRELVLVNRLGLWACDLGTARRHACLDDRR